MKYFFVILVLCVTIARADQRILLAEFSTSATCTQCPIPTQTLYAYLQQKGRAHIAVVVYHTPNPSADPFYNENIPEIQTRATAYNIQNNPKFFVDGFDALQDKDSWGTAMNYEVTQPSPLTITLDGSFNSASVSGMVNVHLSQTPPAGSKLFAAITETGIDYSGVNGEPTHDDVFRQTIGGWSGVDLGSATTTQLTFTLGVDNLREPGFPHPWDPDSCRVIVWLQNPTISPSDKQSVDQAAQIWVSSLTTAVLDSHAPSSPELRISPNPVHDIVDLHLASRTADAKLSIVDLLGRTVYSATGDAIPSHVSLVGRPTGVYRVVLTQSGRVISSTSLVRN